MAASCAATVYVSICLEAFPHFSKFLILQWCYRTTSNPADRCWVSSVVCWGGRERDVPLWAHAVFIAHWGCQSYAGETETGVGLASGIFHFGKN